MTVSQIVQAVVSQEKEKEIAEVKPNKVVK